MKKFSSLIQKLKDKKATLEDIRNTDLANNYFVCDDSPEDMLKTFGLPICQVGDFYGIETVDTKIDEQVFSFVDIETNGSNPKKSQIIEIAAVKTKGCEIIDKFDSMVYCNEINEMITEITGIDVLILKDKPIESKVIHDFRIFLGDSVFVAHNVDFDYSFVSQSMEKYDLPPLLNRRLCTIELAKKTIEAERYGLRFLADMLKLEGFLHHRAYSDALASFEIFKKSLELLPEDVEYTEDLIEFSKKNTKQGA